MLKTETSRDMEFLNACFFYRFDQLQYWQLFLSLLFTGSMPASIKYLGESRNGQVRGLSQEAGLDHAGLPVMHESM